MSKTWFVVRVLTTLVVIGLLIIGGFAIHRIGWSQGYVAGQLAAGGEEGAAAPYAPYSFGHPGRYFGFAPFPFGAGLFLTVGLLILLLIGIGRIFRFWAWRMTGGPQGQYWHRPHGPMPRWCWGWEKPFEERTERTEPEAETGAGEAEN
jgi:hypothetical protein